MIVVDLGCCPWDGDHSIEPLIDRFHPDVLYGFDPLIELEHGYDSGETWVELHAKAAWTSEGFIDLGVGAPSQLDATVMPEKNSRREWTRLVSVPTFDFAAWLTDRPGAVVKMNVEGAEFPLLERLHETGQDETIELLLVQWHDNRTPAFVERRRNLEAVLRCDVEEWELCVV